MRLVSVVVGVNLSSFVLTLSLALAAGMPRSALAGGCTPSTGPDVIVGDIHTWANWGAVGGISGYSFATIACNIGDQIVPWVAQSNQHPVIAMNAYRLKDGRFEQIGMSWLKHGWGAFAQNFCCTCINPNNFEALGVGCSDPYDEGINGDQDGFQSGGGTVAGLGPRSEVNGATGQFTWPYTTLGQGGNIIYKRLQIAIADLNPSLNPGALYFGESQYITPHDAGVNENNNASYRRFTVGTFPGSYNLHFTGSTQQQKPAIQAWQDTDPTVTIVNIDVPGDGRFILGYKCSDNGNGTWHYEYALHNLNSHRSANSFSIPIGSGAAITNMGFHDVPYHSGDGHTMGTNFSGTDWSTTVSGNSASWSTASFAADPNANALRWGTLYNFRFDASTPPAPVDATIGLYRSGTPASVTVATCGPGPVEPACEADIDGSGSVNVDDLLAVINQWGPCQGKCTADIDGNGTVNVDDLLAVINGWGPCP